MVAGIEAAALLTPVITTNLVFSARRATKGINAMDENPAYGIMNMDIAAAQVLKGTRAAICFNPEIEKSVTESVKGVTNASKFAKGAYNILNLTADYINPVICLTSGIKVLGSDDKIDTAAREALALSAMFAGEGAAKRILGMPITKVINGKHTSIPREALYKEISFLKNYIEKFENACTEKVLFNKIPLKGIPGVIKGILFVLASVFGYKFGTAVANKLLGESNHDNQAKKA